MINTVPMFINRTTRQAYCQYCLEGALEGGPAAHGYQVREREADECCNCYGEHVPAERDYYMPASPTNHQYAMAHGLQAVDGTRLEAGSLACRSIALHTVDGRLFDTFSERDFDEIIREGVQAPGGLKINW